MQLHVPGSREVSLHFVKLQFIVKGHESDALPGGVFDVRDLLAGVGIYDPVRCHPDIEDGLDLVLVEERAIVRLGKTRPHQFQHQTKVTGYWTRKRVGAAPLFGGNTANSWQNVAM